MLYCECRESTSLTTELCYLAPLWQLYQKLLAVVSPGYCDVPSVLRALTELFYTAENLAMVSGFCCFCAVHNQLLVIANMLVSCIFFHLLNVHINLRGIASG